MLMQVNMVVEVKYAEDPPKVLKEALKDFGGYRYDNDGKDIGEVWIVGLDYRSMIKPEEL